MSDKTKAVLLTDAPIIGISNQTVEDIDTSYLNADVYPIDDMTCTLKDVDLGSIEYIYS